MATLEEYARKLDIRGMITTAIITSLAFVCALFWNDAIKSAIETILPESKELSAKFAAALMVTVIVIFASWFLIHVREKTKKHEEELRKLLEKQKSLIERQAKLLRRKVSK